MRQRTFPAAGRPRYEYLFAFFYFKVDFKKRRFTLRIVLKRKIIKFYYGCVLYFLSFLCIEKILFFLLK